MSDDTTIHGIVAALRSAAERRGPIDRTLMQRAANILEDLARKLQPPRNAAGEIEFVVESGVASKTGAPMVQIAVGGTLAQVSLDVARKIAINLLDCASGAEDDAALLVIGRDLGLSREQAAGLIHAVRQARRSNDAHDKPPQS